MSLAIQNAPSAGFNQTADLNLRWAHMSEDTFFDVVAKMVFDRSRTCAQSDQNLRFSPTMGLFSKHPTSFGRQGDVNTTLYVYWVAAIKYIDAKGRF